MKRIILLFLFPGILLGQSVEIPQLIEYNFFSRQSRVIPGSSGEKARGHGCTGEIKEVDTIGRLALVSLHYQNGCYTGSTYSHADFQIESGVITDPNGKNEFTAFLVYPPRKKASKFLGSRHGIFYKFSERKNWNVFRMENGRLLKVASVKASSIKTDQFTKIKGLTASDLTRQTVFVFAPADRRLSAFTQISSGVEAANIRKTDIGDISKYRYLVSASPPQISHRSLSRRYFFLKNQTGAPGILWQDQKTNSIYLSSPGEDLKSSWKKSLPNQGNYELVAGVGDGQGSVYYLTVQKGSGARADRKRQAVLFKTNDQGKLVKKRSVDCGPKGFNTTSHSGNHASMSFANGRLGLIFARTMHRSSDGLNHQGAIAAVFDANSLRLIRNTGQTSGHSFDSFLFTDSKNDFIAIDLGDNYPRGINLHRFNDTRRHSRVVYTFKTHHGTSARSPAGRRYPKYTKISKPAKTFYKWSNDNGTYTELGGVVENDSSYTVVFAGEPYKGYSLNNSRVGRGNTDSRNLGLVQVVREFEKAKGGGNVITDDLVLTKGKTESGGFYTFGGTWSKQRNAGVVWLTDYKKSAKENVRHIKTIKSGQNIIILWEKWQNGSYVETYAMKTSFSGEVMIKAVKLGGHVRLARRDDPFIYGNRILIAGGDSKSKMLELVVIKLQ